MSLYTHEITAGAAWSVTVRAGRTVRFTALDDDANLSTLIIGADQVDRLNIPDTLKAQMSACIRAPMVLMSDRGLALASVVESSLPWHDALTGFGQPAHLERFGSSSYGADRNAWRRSAYTGLISELTKHGLGQTDLHGCVNFFTKIAITDDAQCSLSYADGYSHAGDTVVLRSEQDLLIICAATPHPMNAMAEYRPAGVAVEVDLAEPVGPDDPSIRFRPESARAIEETQKVMA
ncbi:MAG: Urea carboxylase-related aminomethyltransferase [Pseudonocardiales bacterium]|nr:Urea carboxylase-related aminomethyltransferase [Pseudonocardiales bacterium]